MDKYELLTYIEMLGGSAADLKILYDHKNEMDKVGANLVEKYGRGAASGIDDYYHALAQCLLGKMGDRDSQIGLILGRLKEDIYDRARKSSSTTGLLSKEEFEADRQKDLQNNKYGAMLGIKNRNNLTPCWLLLDHKRTRNMINEKIR